MGGDHFLILHLRPHTTVLYRAVVAAQDAYSFALFEATYSALTMSRFRTRSLQREQTRHLSHIAVAIVRWLTT